MEDLFFLQACTTYGKIYHLITACKKANAIIEYNSENYYQLIIRNPSILRNNPGSFFSVLSFESTETSKQKLHDLTKSVDIEFPWLDFKAPCVPRLHAKISKNELRFEASNTFLFKATFFAAYAAKIETLFRLSEIGVVEVLDISSGGHRLGFIQVLANTPAQMTVTEDGHFLAIIFENGVIQIYEVLWKEGRPTSRSVPLSLRSHIPPDSKPELAIDCTKQLFYWQDPDRSFRRISLSDLTTKTLLPPSSDNCSVRQVALGNNEVRILLNHQSGSTVVFLNSAGARKTTISFSQKIHRIGKLGPGRIVGVTDDCRLHFASESESTFIDVDEPPIGLSVQSESIFFALRDGSLYSCQISDHQPKPEPCGKLDRPLTCFRALNTGEFLAMNSEELLILSLTDTTVGRDKLFGLFTIGSQNADASEMISACYGFDHWRNITIVPENRAFPLPEPVNGCFRSAKDGAGYTFIGNQFGFGVVCRLENGDLNMRRYCRPTNKYSISGDPYAGFWWSDVSGEVYYQDTSDLSKSILAVKLCDEEIKRCEVIATDTDLMLFLSANIESNVAGDAGAYSVLGLRMDRELDPSLPDQEFLKAGRRRRISPLFGNLTYYYFDANLNSVISFWSGGFVMMGSVDAYLDEAENVLSVSFNTTTIRFAKGLNKNLAVVLSGNKLLFVNFPSGEVAFSCSFPVWISHICSDENSETCWIGDEKGLIHEFTIKNLL